MHDATAPPAIRIRPWPDVVIDTLGHDPRSVYVETFWLPTLGPTTLLLLRHLAHRFEERGGDEAIDLPVADTAHALGLGPREGRNSPLFRSLGRLVQFDLAYPHSDGTVAVRRNVPPVSRRHVRHLPTGLAAEHQDWVRRSESPRQVAERRARRAAFVLTGLGNDADIVERSLLHIGFQPALCRDAATWAATHHHDVTRVDHPSTLDAA